MSIEPRRVSFVLVLTILSAALIEGTGLAQQHGNKTQVASSRPSMIDAFLNTPVNSTDELVAVLKRDKRLRARYAKHFNMPEDRIIDFIKNALIVDHLRQDRIVSNYCVTKSGRVYALRQVFKKGTKVWALRDGTPILRWACANPLAKRLPMTMASRRPRLSPSPMIAGQKPRTIENPLVPEIPELSAANPVIVAQEPVVVNVENLATAADLTSITSTISGGIPISIPGRIPILPLSAISVPIINTLSRPGGSTFVPVVPEPGTVWLLATGLPLLGLRRFRRPKR